MVSYNDLSILVFALVMLVLSKIAGHLEMKRLATSNRPGVCHKHDFSAINRFPKDSMEDTNG